jgi:hypothetical protein
MEIVENRQISLENRIKVFCSLQNKTEEMCKRAFSRGIDVIYFPESMLSEEFIIEVFRSSDRKLLPGSIPEKFWTEKVKEEAVFMCSENLKLIPYHEQTPKMISYLVRDDERKTQSCIRYANPILVSKELLISAMEDYQYPESQSISDKYMELLELYNSKCNIAQKALEFLNSHKNS